MIRHYSKIKSKEEERKNMEDLEGIKGRETLKPESVALVVIDL